MNKLFSSSWLHISFLVITAALILSIGITKPFVGIHDYNSVDYGNQARNHLKYGLAATKLGMVTDSGVINPQHFSYYTHHPALFPLLISLSFSILGITEWAERLVPILFSIGSVIGMYLIGRRVFNPWLGLVGACLMMVTPMFLYYAKMPVHEPLLLCWEVWLVYAYIEWIRTNEKKCYLGILVLTGLIGLTGWPGYFFIPAILLHVFLFHKDKSKRLLLLPLILVFTFTLHLIHIYILTGDFLGGGMINVFLFRLNNANSVQAQIVGLTWGKYLVQQIRWFFAYFSKFLCLLSGMAMFFIGLKAIKRRPFILNEEVVVLLGLIPMGYPLVFSNAVYIHDYLNIYFLPLIVVAAVYILTVVIQRFRLSIIMGVVVALLVIGIVFVSGKNYFLALQQSENSRIGRELGLAMQQQTKPNQVLLVVAPQFSGFYSKFTQFYADRQVDFVEYPLSEWQERGGSLLSSYAYLVTVDGYLPEQAVNDYFVFNFRAFKKGPFTFYYKE